MLVFFSDSFFFCSFGVIFTTSYYFCSFLCFFTRMFYLRGFGLYTCCSFFFSLLFVNFGVFGFCGCTDEGRVGVRGVGSLRPRDGAPGPDEGLGRDRLPPRRDQGKFAVFLTQTIVLQYTGFLSMTICVRFKRARGVVG